MRKRDTDEITGGSLVTYAGIYTSDCFSIHRVEQLFFKTYML